mmetsp:Transcript_8317/g.27252  ORF Transcript_8317/g.27252 Transcript_8317/m.27252 type:complete len:211 (-) Transcript_8317:18-650(-)
MPSASPTCDAREMRRGSFFRPLSAAGGSALHSRWGSKSRLLNMPVTALVVSMSCISLLHTIGGRITVRLSHAPVSRAKATPSYCSAKLPEGQNITNEVEASVDSSPPSPSSPSSPPPSLRPGSANEVEASVASPPPSPSSPSSPPPSLWSGSEWGPSLASCSPSSDHSRSGSSSPVARCSGAASPPSSLSSARWNAPWPSCGPPTPWCEV